MSRLQEASEHNCIHRYRFARHGVETDKKLPALQDLMDTRKHATCRDSEPEALSPLAPHVSASPSHRPDSPKAEAGKVFECREIP